MSANIWNHTPKDERRKACAAVDFMHTHPGAGHDPDDDTRAAADARARRLGMRPLKPPPVKIQASHRTAGAVELAREVRAGTYNNRAPRWG
jgi:hypothetical protein